MNVYDVIRRPIVSERALKLVEQGKYTFEVAPTATKVQIREAVETIFKVDVVAVNTTIMPGKKRRDFRSRSYGSTPQWKKAIVTLKPDQRIEFFEGV